jgi:hypothetical protein
MLNYLLNRAAKIISGPSQDHASSFSLSLPDLSTLNASRFVNSDETVKVKCGLFLIPAIPEGKKTISYQRFDVNESMFTRPHTTRPSVCVRLNEHLKGSNLTFPHFYSDENQKVRFNSEGQIKLVFNTGQELPESFVSSKRYLDSYIETSHDNLFEKIFEKVKDLYDVPSPNPHASKVKYNKDNLTYHQRSNLYTNRSVKDMIEEVKKHGIDVFYPSMFQATPGIVFKLYSWMSKVHSDLFKALIDSNLPIDIQKIRDDFKIVGSLVCSAPFLSAQNRDKMLGYFEDSKMLFRYLIKQRFSRSLKNLTVTEKSCKKLARSMSCSDLEALKEKQVLYHPMFDLCLDILQKKSLVTSQVILMKCNSQVTFASQQITEMPILSFEEIEHMMTFQEVKRKFVEKNESISEGSNRIPYLSSEDVFNSINRKFNENPDFLNRSPKKSSMKQASSPQKNSFIVFSLPYKKTCNCEFNCDCEVESQRTPKSSRLA